MVHNNGLVQLTLKNAKYPFGWNQRNVDHADRALWLTSNNRIITTFGGMLLRQLTIASYFWFW